MRRPAPPPLRPLCVGACFAVAMLTLLVAPAPGADEHPPTDPVQARAAVLGHGTIRQQQRALAGLAKVPGPEADRVLLDQLARWQSRDLPVALWLDLLEAAAGRDHPAIKALLAQLEREVEKSSDPLRRWRECLEGGDAETGREIFHEKVEAGCARCHSVNGRGGQIGPDLTGLGLRTDRIYILESIVDPNTNITPGFPNVIFTLDDGTTANGIVTAETAADVTVTSVIDGSRRVIPVSQIQERKPLPSAMPPGLATILGKRAVRDLVEFIATSK